MAFQCLRVPSDVILIHTIEMAANVGVIGCSQVVGIVPCNSIGYVHSKM